MKKEKQEKLEQITKQFFEKDFRDWNLNAKDTYEAYYQNLPYNLNNDLWLTKMLLKVEKPNNLFYNDIYEFVRFNSFFQEEKHKFALSIIAYQIKSLEYSSGFLIKKKYNFASKHSEEKFRKVIIKSLKKIGFKKALIEEGLEKYDYMWKEKYKSYNHNLKYNVENQDELEKSNKEEVLNKMNQNYNTKFNYNEETISHIDYILRKYNRKQKLVKEEIEYVLKYLHIYSTKRPFEFTSYLFEIAVFLVCILCNLTIYNIFTIFNNIIYNLINILLYIVIDTLIFYGARKIRKRIVQKKVTKLIAQLEQLLNPIEEVRKEAITEEKKEKNKEEVDTFIIYIGRLYNVIKNNGIDNFKEEIQSLHELANYYMDAKKDLNTTSEISVFYKCPDLWTRFNEIENKVNQKINCSKDIKVNEEYLSSLNMLNDIVVLKRRKEE